MTKRAWRELWLEIGEGYATPKSKRTNEQHRLAYYGFCYFLMGLGKSELLIITRDMAGWVSQHIYWYGTDYGDKNTDGIRAFTACFIAEIGEKEFYRLAEDK